MIDFQAVVFRAAVPIGIVVAVMSCGGGDLALPSAAPATLQAVAGSGQTGAVDEALPDSLVVRVTDVDGAGLAGVRVSWSANGGGDVNPSASVTDADGLAATQRVLGTTPGPYGTSATAEVAEGSPAVFLATAVAGQPNDGGSKIEAAPVTVTASTGSSAAVVTVTVVDKHGNPVSGATVKLSATGSGNRITQPSAPTDANGIATGSFAATGAGAHVIKATANGVALKPTVTVTVVPDAPDQGRSKVIVPDGTAGASTLLTVRLRDQFGNEISGARSKLGVTVSGANSKGTLSVAEADGAEYTARYTPTKVGTDLVQVTFDGATLLGGPFASAVAAGPAAASMTIAVVDPAATLFSPVVDISVQVRDAYGNPTGRANENVAVTASTAGDRRAVAMSYDANTGAYFATFRPWQVGTYQIEISVDGVAIPGSPFTTVMRSF